MIRITADENATISSLMFGRYWFTAYHDGKDAWVWRTHTRKQLLSKPRRSREHLNQTAGDVFP